MATKMYLHRATTAVTGTLPAAGVSVSAVATPTQIAAGGGTNRTMTTTISAVAQTSNVLTTLARTTAQSGLILRCVSDYVAAQTFAAQQISMSFAQGESNANSGFTSGALLVLWRPSTGAVVGAFSDDPDTFANAWSGSGSTVEQWTSGFVNTASPVTSQNGDVIIVEQWRLLGTQSKSTSYSNTLWYDGTTEVSSTNAATYVNFANTITFGTAAAAEAPPPDLAMGLRVT